MKAPLVQIRHLSVILQKPKYSYKILRDVTLNVNEGEVVGLVGESGCGKTMLVLAVANLLPKNIKVSGGEIFFAGKDITHMKNKERQALLGKEVGFIFQDPMTSLNPLKKIGVQVSEGLVIHSDYGSQQILHRTMEVFEEMGLPSDQSFLNKYPHELSGGMRQRVMIAIALINRPKLIIADEPTTALDATTQAQIIGLLKDIKKQYDCSIIFISHDLRVVNQFCDRVSVMYMGSIVECASPAHLFEQPFHPYTKGLIRSIPTIEKKGQSLYCIPGTMPHIKDYHEGCTFANRCDERNAVCANTQPVMTYVSKDHAVSCHRLHEGGNQWKKL